MAKLTASNFGQERHDLYDFYEHGNFSKRDFVDRTAIWAVGGGTAAALLNKLSPDYAVAEQVSFNDPAIVPESTRYPSPDGDGAMRGHLVRPGEGRTRFPPYGSPA